MGQVIEVRFGAERHWDEMRRVVLEDIKGWLERSWGDRVDRAEFIADLVIKQMRSLDEFLTLNPVVNATVPPGWSDEQTRIFVQAIIDQAMQTIVPQFKKLRDAAHGAIALAASGAVVSLSLDSQ